MSHRVLPFIVCLLAPAVALAAAPPAMDVNTAIKTLREGTDPQLRLKAAQRLGELKDPKGIPVLVETLYPAAGPEGEIWFVRKACTIALSKIGKPAEEPVRKLVADPDPWVRVKGVATLALMKAPDAKDVALKLLKSDPDDMVRVHSLFALRDLKDKSVIPALREIQKNDKSADIRGRAEKIANKLEGGA